MLNRRAFLRKSSLVAFAPFVPTFLDELARAASAKPDARILVVVQLDGGNDGINTVVPFGDEAYGQLRKELQIKPDVVLKINNHIGLHPAMRGMSQLLEQGRLSIVQGVGYPNPNRSHFESMRIWQTAQLTPKDDQNGWLGSAFDQLPWPRPVAGPDAIYVGDNEMPRALIGRRTEAAAISNADDLALRVAVPDAAAMQNGNNKQDVAAFVRRSMLSAYGTSRELTRTRDSAGGKAALYPQSKLAQQLGTVSQLIKSGAGTRVYYTSQSGYDTHYSQLPQHADVLAELSGAVKAFMDDLHTSGLSDRVLLMAFSEFGRRAAENGSLGTDHGAAGPVFLAGDHLTGRLVGETPSLSDLSAGDIKTSVDFRRIYATLLKQWLEIPPSAGLAPAFEPLPLLRA
jgi:uncharacterized protein (DUF1501 family)